MKDTSLDSMADSPKERRALQFALAIHDKVKLLANAYTAGVDQTFHEQLVLNGVPIEVHYEARDDECHRGITVNLDGGNYRLWCECRGWMHMSRDDEHIFSQRPRDDIAEKFEGNIDEFVAIADKVLRLCASPSAGPGASLQ